MNTPVAWPDPEIEVRSLTSAVSQLTHLCECVLQSHNQILRAAASGDVTALRQFANETDPVLITAVQNKVRLALYSCLL